jgi:DNA primase
MLPEGQDPDDLAQTQGRAGLEAVLAAALPLADVVWRDAVEAGPLDTPERRAALESRLQQQTEAIGDRAVRDHYRADMRARLDNLFGRGIRQGYRSGGERQDSRFRRGGRDARFQPPADLPPSAAMRRHPLASSAATVTEGGEGLALLTVLLWMGIMFAGRYIAYYESF